MSALEDALEGVEPEIAAAMVRGATDLRHLVDVDRAADNGAHAVLGELLDPSWDLERTAIALVMAVTALANRLDVP